MNPTTFINNQIICKYKTLLFFKFKINQYVKIILKKNLN